jgi:hypothetical protein
MCSQTPNNAAVTAPTSADTPNHTGHDLRLQYKGGISLARILVPGWIWGACELSELLGY